MKKKLLSLLLITALVLAFTACDSDDKSLENDNSSLTQEQEEDKTPFEQIEIALADMEIKYEKTVMGAELVGATQGIKYKFDNGQIEMYLFSDDAFQDVSKNKSVTLEGFGAFPVNVHASLPLALIMKNVENEDEIVSAFMKIK